MTDKYGNIRTMRTSSFGYYSFDSISVGGIVIINAASKQYQFEPRVISVTDDMENVNIEAQP